MTPDIGQLAALLTAMCYSISSIFFTYAGRQLGALISNRLRLVMAVVLLGAIHWVIYGSPIPATAGMNRWMWLGISGIVGLAIGDLFLFQAYITIGPRLGLLFLSLAPALASILAWLILGETLNAGTILGISLTLVGIAWVVLESNHREKPSFEEDRAKEKSIRLKGILAGIIAATGQALGVVLAKNGLTGNFPALSGSVIRMIAAFVALWLVTLIQGQAKSTFQQASTAKPALLYILGGAVFGPIMGVTLSLFAIQHTSVGIASTIIALPPVFLLPIGHFTFKERISWQAITGTILAILGVALLFWL